MINRRALIISSDDEIVATNGWLRRFLKRKHLAIRRITTSSIDFPKNCSDIEESFIQECKNKLLIDSVDKNSMGETSIYLDFAKDITYEVKGTRRVRATTTGNEITRLSIAFSVTAEGQKLKALI